MFSSFLFFVFRYQKVLEQIRIFSIPDALGSPKGPDNRKSRFLVATGPSNIPLLGPKIVKKLYFCIRRDQINKQSAYFWYFSPAGHPIRNWTAQLRNSRPLARNAQNKPPGAYFGLVLGLWPEMLQISLLGPILVRFSEIGQKC